MTRTLALLVAIFALACTSGRSSRPAAQEPTQLVVDNRGYTDMVVYVLEGSQRVRLGLATGNSRTTMTIPARLIGFARELQLLADPVGSNRTSVTERISVRPGDRVGLVIMP